MMQKFNHKHPMHLIRTQFVCFAGARDDEMNLRSLNLISKQWPIS